MPVWKANVTLPKEPWHLLLTKMGVFVESWLQVGRIMYTNYNNNQTRKRTFFFPFGCSEKMHSSLPSSVVELFPLFFFLSQRKKALHHLPPLLRKVSEWNYPDSCHFH